MLKNIPNEVIEVWAYQMSKRPVGTETYKRLQDIINKYPEHFPQEHIYNSIPNEVHIKYREETVPDEPTFTLTEGYGSIAITDISTDTDAALPLTQWQIYRSPGAEIWTNISLASGNNVVNGDGAYTITGLSAVTEYSI
jgi:hypothetical protein